MAKTHAFYLSKRHFGRDILEDKKIKFAINFSKFGRRFSEWLEAIYIKNTAKFGLGFCGICIKFISNLERLG